MFLFLFIFISLLGFGFLGWFVWRDRRFLKKPTKEALGPELKKEIEEEKKLFSRHQERFNQAMMRAKRKRVKERAKNEGGGA